MQRIIKFRAWDKVINEMKEVAFVDHYLRYPTRFEMMQYTGLKDKNGVEIYEGDTARQCFAGAWWQGEVSISSTQGAMVGGKSLWPHNIEVIGNIYENKELLDG